MKPSQDRGSGRKHARLRRILGIRDVYAISTGAMFSSGFFLLPGLAAAEIGPAVVLAYLAAGLLILPAMLSVAELATAMPRAGGAYYFIDRSLGPLAGTIGGLGTWLSLVLKSAFALLGMGAYLVIFFDVPIKPVAAALTVVFAAVNLFGAKEGARLQRGLVYVLVGVLTFFLVNGLWSGLGASPSGNFGARVGGAELPTFSAFAGTIGMVFVSYAGLTKVASVAEEVRDPDRNIPRGMTLSLLTATTIYVLGVGVMVLLIDMATLTQDLTPVATAAEAAIGWMPRWLVLGLVVAAAVAAFASTGNAGILSSSRYPLAMARDGLLPARFGKLARSGVPALGVVTTAAAMLACILLLDVATVAKLAGAFQLLLFAMLHIAVIVMRSSGLAGYRPGYRTPLYPWMQLGGIVISLGLIALMGWLAIAFTLGLSALCAVWYFVYARRRVTRRGALFHVFARLGRRAHAPLADELGELRDELDEARRLAAASLCRACGAPAPSPCLTNCPAPSGPAL